MRPILERYKGKHIPSEYARVEAEVKRHALGVLSEGQRAEILSFCLDDNYGWDDGLICGGRMSILADPLAKSANYRAKSAASSSL